MSATPFDPRLLHERRLRLSFGGELEARFVAHSAERSIGLLQVTFSVAIVLFIAWVFIDGYSQRRFDDPVVLGLVGGLAGAANLLALSTVLMRPLQQFVQAFLAPRVAPATLARVPFLPALMTVDVPHLIVRFLPLLLAGNGLIMAAVAARCIVIGLDPPYEIVILHELYTFFLTGLLFRWALPVGVVGIAAYLGAARVLHLTLHRWIDEATALGFIWFLCAIGCYLQERLRRRNWLQALWLDELARKDGLTGLLNRRAFFESAAQHLRQALRDDKPCALLLGDVDHFKRYNDTYGHLAGDDCLRALARELAACARRPLDLAARTGGEEFAILLYDCPPDAALERAEALRAAVEALAMPHRAAARKVVTLCIGVTTQKPTAELPVEQLISQADRALYAAKAAGRNAVRVAEPDPEPVVAGG
jgi:diguanylate cyclase (GGDEF)-like protein